MAQKIHELAQTKFTFQSGDIQIQVKSEEEKNYGIFTFQSGDIQIKSIDMILADLP